jgi:hypothetical protein
MIRKVICMSISSSLLVASAIAGECYKNKADCQKGEECTSQPALYNAPARIETHCMWGISLSGSFIYWKPDEKGLTLGASHPAVHSDKAHVLHMDMDYKPGFTVGLGFGPKFDHWKIDLGYLRFHINEHKSSSTENLFGDWLAQSFASNKQKASWHLDMDLLEGSISRPFYSGRALSFIPAVGIIGGWIDQNYRAEYNDEINNNDWIFSHNHSDSWLIGPKVGLETRWLLGYGFRFFGNGSFSLFFQHFTTKIRQDNRNIGGSLAVHEYDKRSFVIPNLNLSLGFGWGTYMGKWGHFDFLAGYEFRFYWKQNMMRYLNDRELLSNDGKAGDLYLQGLTLTATFDF